MTEVTLHLKAEGQRACVVCGADLGRRVSRWWLVNCWTADPKHYRAQQSRNQAETVRPCGVLASGKTPNGQVTRPTRRPPTPPQRTKRPALAGRVGQLARPLWPYRRKTE